MEAHGLLLVADKPAGMSSNRLLSSLKRRYGYKKGGFSGTLDPFAEGTLVVALGSYTRLLPHLVTTPKRYRATLHLGAYSPTLDTEQIEHIDEVAPLQADALTAFIEGLRGALTMPAPRYSAKHIDGKRAYDLARAGVEFETPMVESRIEEASLISYNHPFVIFEATVSKGTYIRSLGAHIAQHFGCHGALTTLRRLFEGGFAPSDNPVDPLPHLTYPVLQAPIDSIRVRNGKLLRLADLPEGTLGRVVLYYPQQFITIVKVGETEVSYVATVDL